MDRLRWLVAAALLMAAVGCGGRGDAKDRDRAAVEPPPDVGPTTRRVMIDGAASPQDLLDQFKEAIASGDLDSIASAYRRGSLDEERMARFNASRLAEADAKVDLRQAIAQRFGPAAVGRLGNIYPELNRDDTASGLAQLIDQAKVEVEGNLTATARISGPSTRASVSALSMSQHNGRWYVDPEGGLELPTTNPADVEKLIRINRERAAAYRDSIELARQASSLEGFARSGRNRMDDYRARSRALMGRE
jgi:hypothetical protein